MVNTPFPKQRRPEGASSHINPAKKELQMKTRINKDISDSSPQHPSAVLPRATASWKARTTLATLLWLVTCALTLAQGTTDTAYVTLVHPDGTRAYYSLPASPTACDRGAKLQQAKTDAQSGDTIVVGPGTAQTVNLLKNGVNWHFMAGAIINGGCCGAGCPGGGSIFNDAGVGPVTSTISGSGSFHSVSGGAINIINLQNTSNISFTADSLIGDRGFGPILTRKATLHIKANTISSSQSAYPAIWWLSGPLHVEAHEILSDGVVIQSNAVSGESVGGYLWVQANLIKSSGFFTNAAIVLLDAEATTRQWIQALQIQGPGAIRKEATSGPGLTYVRAEKVFGQIDHRAGTLYVDAMKISPFLPSPSQHPNDSLIKLTGGNSWINILQIDDSDLEDSTTAVPVVAASGGTHYLRGSSLARTSAGDGINVSGGTLTVNGLAINTFNGAYDLVQTGGILKTLSCGYSLLKASGTITEGDPKVGILGTAAFDARSGQPIDQNGIFSGIIVAVTATGQGQYKVSFGRSEPDTNYMVTTMAESSSGTGTVSFWSKKSTDGFVLNLVDFGSGALDDQDGVRVTVSRIPQ